MKKIVIMLAGASLVGTTIFSMENAGKDAQANEENQQGFLGEFSKLPKELRQKSVSLSLQAEVAKYELINQIQTKNSFSSVAFSPDQKTLLTGGTYGATLWDRETGKKMRDFSSGRFFVDSVAWSPDGNSIVAESSDNMIYLWNVHTGQELNRFKVGDTLKRSVVFSPDGKYLLLAGSFEASLWDPSIGTQLKRFMGHEEWVNSVALSLDGKTALTGSSDGTARLWDVETGKELQRFSGDRGSITSVALSPDGKTALTGSSDNAVRLWDVGTGEELQQFIGHTDKVSSVAFSPDGKTVLTGSLDTTARLWDIKTGKELQRLSNLGSHNSIRSVAFSSNGNFIALVSSNGIILLYELRSPFTPQQKEEAYKIFLEKDLYSILNPAPQEEKH